jgi:hypothetical protein
VSGEIQDEITAYLRKDHTYGSVETGSGSSLKFELGWLVSRARLLEAADEIENLRKLAAREKKAADEIHAALNQCFEDSRNIIEERDAFRAKLLEAGILTT